MVYAGLTMIALQVKGDGSNWMSSANGRLGLSEFTLPGTHNAGALHEPFPGTARCQDLSLGEQLNGGVRFLDIRCRHLNDAFVIHHGMVDQKLTFTDVLNTVDRFLSRNPTECVILSVQEEHTPSGNTRSFEATFHSYTARTPGRWVLSPGIPTLDQARGKIVLFRRFAAEAQPLGIDASRWPNNTTFTTGSLRIQDCYNVSDNDIKWGQITNLLDEAQAGAAETLYVNFFSGTRLSFGLPNITGVVNAINPSLTRYFTAHRHGRYGVIVMDFADAHRCRLIYDIRNTRVRLQVAPDPARAGESLTLTATVTGTHAQPTGSVVFNNHETTLGSALLNDSGKATLVVPELSAGAHSLGAVYTGDATYAPMLSAMLTQTGTSDGTNTLARAAGVQ